MKFNKIDIYIDGGSRNNGSPDAKAAWAVIVYADGVEVSEQGNYYVGLTNSAMEVYAMLAGVKVAYSLRDLADEINIYSDSSYCVNTYNTWLYNWIKSGILSQKKYPEYWDQVYAYKLALAAYDVKVLKVKGHSGVEGNEAADGYLNLLMDKSIHQELDILSHKFDISKGIEESYEVATLSAGHVTTLSLSEVAESNTELRKLLDVTDMFMEDNKLVLKVNGGTEPETLISVDINNLIDILKEAMNLPNAVQDLDGNIHCPVCNTKIKL